jgi:putative membrane protein
MKYIFIFLKGIAMGAANVIPGVSGGTVALITGIFETLIDAIKSLNLEAFKLLIKGKFSEFANHINLGFLISVFLGIGVSIFTFARLLDYLFNNFPVYIWSFFFGLILASVWFVAKTIEKWNWSVILNFTFGTAVAVTIAMLNPASENDHMIYLVLCGVVAASSMILPGLSGSFVLILMGNYQLVMIDSVNQLNLTILLPVAVGAAIGILGFSHFLSWIFKKFRNQTIALLSGFILGSLIILWPWKEELTQTFGEKTKVIGYQWLIPEFGTQVLLAGVFLILGFLAIYLMEKLASKSKKV